MISIEAWLSADMRRDIIRVSVGATFFWATLRDENGHETRGRGGTVVEAIADALRTYEREQIESRAQMDADDAAFLAELERTGA